MAATRATYKTSKEKFPFDFIVEKRAVAELQSCEYLIKWSNCTEQTWEPCRVIEEDCPAVAFAYEELQIKMSKNLSTIVEEQKKTITTARGEAIDAQKQANLMAEQIAKAERIYNVQIAEMHQRCMQLEAQCRTANQNVAMLFQTNRNSQGDFTCELCQQHYNRKDRLMAHMNEKHIHGKRIDIVCSVCKKTFTRMASLRRHMWDIHQIVLP